MRFAIAFLLATYLLAFNSAKASHLAASDISYAYAGGDSFLVTLNVYYDCTGSSPFLQADFYYATAVSTSIKYVSAIGVDSGIIVPSCLLQQNTPCTLPPGPLIGYRHWIYKSYLHLPLDSVDPNNNRWFVYWSEQARNANINTLRHPSQLGMKCSFYVDLNKKPFNNSAIFLEKPVPYRCVNKNSIISQGVYDQDGDSLSFQLITASQGNGLTIEYDTLTNGVQLSYLYPNPCNSPPIVSPSNGDIYVNASLVGAPNPTQFIAVYVIQADEYRNGVLIGSTMRDMQVIFKPLASCDTVLPGFNGIKFVNGNFTPADTIVAMCDSSRFFVKMNQPIACSSIASNGSDFTLEQVGTGIQIPISKAEGFSCNQYSNTTNILLTLDSPITTNSAYILSSKIGTDSNTLFTSCGLKMPIGQQAIVVVNGCIRYNEQASLENVSVGPGDSLIELYWRENVKPIDSVYFTSWQLYRDSNQSPELIADVKNVRATKFSHGIGGKYLKPVYDPSYAVSTYSIGMQYRKKYKTSLSNQLSNVLLQKPFDTAERPEILILHWNRYLVNWTNGILEIQTKQLNASSDWKNMSQIPFSDSSFSMVKPRDGAEMLVRIAYKKFAHTTLPNEIAYSNTLKYKNPLPYPEHIVSIPTVFTPNGDGVNDVFQIRYLEDHPNTKLVVANRWGQTVFEASNYQNNWSGINLADGEYYYLLENTGDPLIGTRKGFVRIQR